MYVCAYCESCLGIALSMTAIRQERRIGKFLAGLILVSRVRIYIQGVVCSYTLHISIFSEGNSNCYFLFYR